MSGRRSHLRKKDDLLANSIRYSWVHPEAMREFFGFSLPMPDHQDWHSRDGELSGGAGVPSFSDSLKRCSSH
jgi:hypothetical protein